MLVINPNATTARRTNSSSESHRVILTPQAADPPAPTNRPTSLPQKKNTPTATAATRNKAGETLDASLGGGGEVGASVGVCPIELGAGGEAGISGAGALALGAGAGTGAGFCVGEGAGAEAGGGVAGGDAGAGAGAPRGGDGGGGGGVAGGCALGAGVGDAPGACDVATAKSMAIATATRWRRAIGSGDGGRWGWRRVR